MRYIRAGFELWKGPSSNTRADLITPTITLKCFVLAWTILDLATHPERSQPTSHGSNPARIYVTDIVPPARAEIFALPSLHAHPCAHCTFLAASNSYTPCRSS